TRAAAPVLHVMEMASRVAAVVTVVAHHKEMVSGNNDVEGDGRRLQLCTARPGGEVGGLVQRLAVDGEAARRVAAGHAIPFDPDHTLDQVLGARVREHTDELKALTDWASLARGGAGEPA